MTHKTVWCSAALIFALSACDSDVVGVGDPCLPQSVPCAGEGEDCGFAASESYVETQSEACKTSVCVVHRLDNGTQGSVPADPRRLCSDAASEPGCVTEAQVEDAIYCSCRCDGPKGAGNFCECPDGFACQELLNSGDEAGSYCVRRGP